MIAGRPYRAAISHQAALAELRRQAGVQFDPDLVEVFAALFADGLPWDIDGHAVGPSSRSGRGRRDRVVAAPEPVGGRRVARAAAGRSGAAAPGGPVVGRPPRSTTRSTTGGGARAELRRTRQGRPTRRRAAPTWARTASG